MLQITNIFFNSVLSLRFCATALSTIMWKCYFVTVPSVILKSNLLNKSTSIFCKERCKQTLKITSTTNFYFTVIHLDSYEN